MMEQDTTVTTVIFRKYKNGNIGDIVAIFPTELGTMSLGTCSSYETVGQHGSCNPYLLIDATEPATPDEYATLKTELERIGYSLDIKKRNWNGNYAIRKAKLRAMQEASFNCCAGSPNGSHSHYCGEAN